MKSVQEMLSQLSVDRAAARQMAYGAAVQMLSGQKNTNNPIEVLQAFMALSDGIFAKIMDDVSKDTVSDNGKE